MTLPAARLQSDDPLRKTGQRAFPATLILHRLPQHDFCLVSHESLEILCFDQLTFEPRRADLQRVAVARYDVLDIQNSSYLLRNKFAIGVRDAMRGCPGLACGRSIKMRNTRPRPAPRKCDFDDLDAFGLAHPLSDLGDLGDDFFFAIKDICRQTTGAIKSGLSPTGRFDNFIIHV